MRLLLAMVACAALAWAADGRADTASDAQAHAAYERGTAAFRKGDYPTAAREYSAADALAPNPVALQAALDASVLADDPVLGETLLERARRLPRSEALAGSIAGAERRFAHRTGVLVLACAAPPCLTAIDGVATPPGVATVVRVGSHTVTLETGGTITTRVVAIAPDQTFTVTPDARSTTGPTPMPMPAPMPAPTPTPTPALAPAPAPTPAPSPHGLSPTFFWLSAGATTLAVAATIASGADTAAQHSTFVRRCATNPGSSCPGLRTDGIAAQTRTNVLVGVSAALAAATVVTAFVVHWHDASIRAGAGSLSFDARF
jgi:hypothetical protein